MLYDRLSNNYDWEDVKRAGGWWLEVGVFVFVTTHRWAVGGQQKSNDMLRVSVKYNIPPWYSILF